VNIIKTIKNGPSYTYVNGVYHSSSLPASNITEDIYLRTRKKEGRIYDDRTVKSLPEFSDIHRYYKEWQVRKSSSKKLTEYISSGHGEKNILDLGCGNGWLSNKLSDIKSTNVIGMDLNQTELEQATRVFLTKENLVFVYGEIFTDSLNEIKFDFIILSAVIQYFSDINTLVENLLKRLSPSGEIHIIDSPFYSEKELPEARKRTTEYYNKLSIPEMTDYYNHHTLRELLSNYHVDILYNPKNIFNRIKNNLSGSNSPFYWLRIKK
jgi:ubiquinone/menaquinone biosynthesis C-methylase UbiE